MLLYFIIYNVHHLQLIFDKLYFRDIAKGPVTQIRELPGEPETCSFI